MLGKLRARLTHFSGVPTVLAGSIATQAINFLTYPLLARLYTPAQFGLFAVFLAASMIPSAFACLRYELAIPVARAAMLPALAALCVRVAAGVAVLTTLILLLIGERAYAGLTPVMALAVGAAIFMTGLIARSALLVQREERFGRTAWAVVLRTLVTVGAQAALWLVRPDAYGLIAGYLLGLAVQTGMLEASIRSMRGRLRPGGVARAAGRYRKQILVDVPGSLLSALNLNVQSLFLLSLAGERIAGLYSMAFRIAALPLQVMSEAQSQVFFQRAGREWRAGQAVWPVMRANLLLAAAMAGVILIGLLLLARPFTRIYLGEQWVFAGDILVILAPMLAARSLCVSVQTIVFVIGRVPVLMLSNLALLINTVAIFALARASGMAVSDYLQLYSATQTAIYLGFTAVLIWLTRKAEARNARLRAT